MRGLRKRYGRFSAHRDHAAAQVILARGLRVGQLTEASEVQRGR